MNRNISISLVGSLLWTLFCCLPVGAAQTPHTTTTRLYDPTRDAAKDIAGSLAEAKRTHRNVLLDVGGEWCSWCHIMDHFFDAHPELSALRDKNFVFVRVNFSPENENKAVLSRYPEIVGYPHLFVLDSDGKLLRDQRTNVLESGSSYDLSRFMAFLTEWAPRR
jgi:thiol:disulfide interchange protein